MDTGFIKQDAKDQILMQLAFKDDLAKPPILTYPLPKENYLQMHNSKLTGTYILQIVSYRDIGSAKRKELQDEKEKITTTYSSNKTRALKLWLKDSSNQENIIGFEYKHVVGFEKIQIGAKIQIRDVIIKRGVLLLTGENTLYLGGIGFKPRSSLVPSTATTTTTTTTTTTSSTFSPNNSTINNATTTINNSNVASISNNRATTTASSKAKNSTITNSNSTKHPNVTNNNNINSIILPKKFSGFPYIQDQLLEANSDKFMTMARFRELIEFDESLIEKGTYKIVIEITDGKGKFQVQLDSKFAQMKLFGSVAPKNFTKLSKTNPSFHEKLKNQATERMNNLYGLLIIQKLDGILTILDLINNQKEIINYGNNLLNMIQSN